MRCAEVVRVLHVLRGNRKNIVHVTLSSNEDSTDCTILSYYTIIRYYTLLYVIIRYYTITQLDEYLEQNALISNTQHGFRRGRSTQTNLIEFFNDTTRWLDDGKNFDVLYFDFAKAFDKVCHERLLTKLESIGITGKMLSWFRDWLSDRNRELELRAIFRIG